jgi:phage FluMu protein Com
MKLTERVSYLQGLMDGLEIDETTKEGKVLAQMADILQEMALSIEDIESEIDEVVELVDTLDQDLGDLEEDYYGLDDDDEDYDEDEELDLDDDFYEVICPTCGDTICLTQEMIDEGSINCPNCKELLEFDFDDEETEE